MPNRETLRRNKNAELEEAARNAAKPPVLVDAAGAVVGRLASHLAHRLLRGATIVVLNSEQALVTGSSSAIKERYRFKTTVGTRRKGPFPSRMPHLILKRTVRGMLPYQRPHGRAALKRLTCHLGTPAEFANQQAERIEDALRQPEKSMSLLELSRFLGKHVEVKAAG